MKRADIKINGPKPDTGYIDGQVITCVLGSDLHKKVLRFINNSKVLSIEYVRFYGFPSEAKEKANQVVEPRTVKMSEHQARILIKAAEDSAEEPAREVAAYIKKKLHETKNCKT